MEEEAKVENVTNVVKSGISLVIANLVVEEGTAHLVVVVVEVVVPRLGKFFFIFTDRFWLIILNSYSCGGVGHMSRDCVQGAKCYNCSNFVSQIFYPFYRIVAQ
jgi:hypothetical protein